MGSRIPVLYCKQKSAAPALLPLLCFMQVTFVKETSSKPCDIVPCEVAWAIVFKMHCKLC